MGPIRRLFLFNFWGKFVKYTRRGGGGIPGCLGISGSHSGVIEDSVIGGSPRSHAPRSPQIIPTDKPVCLDSGQHALVRSQIRKCIEVKQLLAPRQWQLNTGAAVAMVEVTDR